MNPDQIDNIISTLMSKVKDTQMTEEEYRYIANHLGDGTFIVFGTGHDSNLWRYATNGNVIFLEHDSRWIPKDAKDVYKVEYTTDISQAFSLLDELKGGSDINLTMKMPPMPLSGPPRAILVDSPPGYKEGTPGRMQSLYAASLLAGPDTHVFVHDCDRPIESTYTDYLFSRYITQLTKLRHVKL